MDKVKSSKKKMPTVTERAKYPWDTLNEVEDGFFFEDDDTHGRQTKICSAALQHGRRCDPVRVYTTEVGVQDGKKGVHVWLSKILTK